jgi:hypothetical protein
MTRGYIIRRKRSRQLKAGIAKKIIITFFVVTGGLTGILLGTVILGWTQPDNPVYLGIRGFLEGLLGLTRPF